ncbi:MAG: ribosome maturation factor RimM [Thermoleophilia bacterium]
MIGRLGRPHGVRGVMHARPTGATLATLEPGEGVWVAPDGAPARGMVVEAIEGSGERLRLRLAGVADRDAAAALTGAVLEVPPERVVAPDDPDTYFVEELVGCEMRAGGRPLGEVTGVHAAPANDIIEVAGDEGPLLIPFTADAIEEVDLDAGIIRVRADLLD